MTPRSKSEMPLPPETAGLPGDALAARRSFWRLVIAYRYLAIVCLALAPLVFPVFGERRVWLAAVVVVVGIPYNVVCDVVVRRSGRLPPITAYGDYAAILAVAAIAPALYTAAVMILLAILTQIVLGFGRRVGFSAIGVAVVGLVTLGFVHQPTGWVVSVVVYSITATIGATVLGEMAEGELGLRLRYRDLVSGVDAVVWEAPGSEGPPDYIDEKVVELLGYPCAAWRSAGHWESVIHPDDAAVIDDRRKAISAGGNDEAEYRITTAGGDIVWVHEVVKVMTNLTGEVTSRRGVIVDVSDRKRAEERVRQYADIVEHIGVALLLVQLEDPDDETSLRIIAANPEAGRLTNRSIPDVIGQLATDAFPRLVGSEIPERIARVIRTGEPAGLEDFTVEGGEHPVVLSLRAFPLPGQAAGVSLDDVTDRAMTARALRHQALHDPLTGLPNRTLLNDRLGTALRTAERTATPVALLVMDLDQFKEVNDALGHHHGDRLLVELSNRLTEVLREADTIVRLGGDEFAILLTTNASLSGAITVAQRITRALEEPVLVDGISLQTGASVGIAFFPEHATDAETLVQKADIAMYAAKRSAAGFAVYAPEHDRSSVWRLTLLGELRRAIHQDQFEVHYQPIIELASGEVVGVEALVRWNHPDHGLMLPVEFIELAEVSGMIQPLTQIVLEQAARDVVRWRKEGHDLSVAVNLSVRSLYSPELDEWIAVMLSATELPAQKLCLELTESEVMDDPLVAMQVLGQLQRRGINISVDDFGTGQSSLSYLQNLPINEVKIDRGFISEMEQGDVTLVRSIIDLAHNLGLRVVAEGVEQGDALGRLRGLGCDRAQGFFVSPPLPVDACDAWLATKGQGSWNRHLRLLGGGRSAG
ncbi:MAG: hypothetical protein JJLCMIEE_03355 [Acidimicrobiales bacterium]|nr:MAG: EAL domain-containing protein [Actinomycetota bacterium]MBV6510224.1 hypothetical protein [Acidimicrobiales bacterium]RIK04191.1 MAG: hypothetical protein DCC48_13940 [Acidobacteriota bacterium]